MNTWAQKTWHVDSYDKTLITFVITICNYTLTIKLCMCMTWEDFEKVCFLEILTVFSYNLRRSVYTWWFIIVLFSLYFFATLQFLFCFLSPPSSPETKVPVLSMLVPSVHCTFVSCYSHGNMGRHCRDFSKQAI